MSSVSIWLDDVFYISGILLFRTEPENRIIRASSFLIQQAYIGMKYRMIFISAGCRELTDEVVNFELSSAGWSGRVMHGLYPARAGFIDFVDIPFTKGWVQIKGELAYGKFMDNDF